MTIIESKEFSRIAFDQSVLAKAEYYKCRFIDCNFSGSTLSNIVFSECEFVGCDMSNANINGAAFKEVKFNACKMFGLQFNSLNSFLFSAEFDQCDLTLSIFYRLKIKGFKFVQCKLQEVDFTEADLTNVEFENCNLDRAIIVSCILDKSDFRTAYNYQIDLDRNKLKKPRFSLQEVPGLLYKYNISID